jgi:hypothetical protein
VPDTIDEIDTLLRPLAPVLAREADAILDLRQLLALQGHPGKCVRCFFKLFEAAGPEERPNLGLLQSWLEKHVEISVRSGSEELEALPFQLRNEEGLEQFCLRSIDQIRMDRDYGALPLSLSFRYKARAA